MTRKKMTSSERRCLRAIERRIGRNGYPPTVRELCHDTGFSSPSTVHLHLRSLVDKGYITMSPTMPRTIVVKVPSDA